MRDVIEAYPLQEEPRKRLMLEKGKNSSDPSPYTHLPKSRKLDQR
jgi:hypothetical protein